MKYLKESIKIVIVGGGFAGLAALRYLSKKKKKYNLELIFVTEKKGEFYPLLPDLLADNVSPESLVYPYENEIKKVIYYQDKLRKIDMNSKEIVLKTQEIIKYDYLLLAIGSFPRLFINGTNYFMNVEEAQELRRKVISLLIDGKEIHVYVIGGGYTGIECISALKSLCMKYGDKEANFHLIEKGKEILNGLNGKIRDKILKELENLHIRIHTSSSLEIRDKKILFQEQEIQNSVVVAAAGFKGGGAFVEGFPETGDGRILVDSFLRVNDNIFCAGDTAAFSDTEGRILRQSVNHALKQGKKAAENILCNITQQKMKPYVPLELGFLVPVYGINKAFGKVFFLSVGGRFGMFLHYFMCFYKHFSSKNRMFLLRDFIKNLVTKYLLFK